MKAILGVTGGIAAYKAAELVRLLQQHDFTVQVIMTRHAQEFVRPLTFAALTGEKVICEMFAGDEESSASGAQGGSSGRSGSEDAATSAIEHIEIAQSADVLVVAPLTAHTLARFAAGLSDDFLTTTYLATTAPVVVAPAMNVNMWQHPATQNNVELLRRRGVRIVEPDAGYLACGMLGPGRLAPLENIVEAVLAATAQTGTVKGAASSDDLRRETVLITAGPTREPIDPVRFLSNRSSGRMGYALAEAALARGARVILISGPASIEPPAGDRLLFIPVTTAAEMAAAALEHFPQATMAVLAAAVADVRPARQSTEKVRKTDLPAALALEPTIDILRELGKRKTRQVVIGFAAETGQQIENARRKLDEKHADLIVFNDVSRSDIGFDAHSNAVTLVSREGALEIPRNSKLAVAHRVLDRALELAQQQAAAHG